MSAVFVVLIAMLVIAGAGMLIALLWGVILPQRRRTAQARASAEAEAAAVVEAGGRAEPAESLGQKSRRWMQLIGPGMLMLTSDELRFRLFTSERLTRIPLAAIHSVRVKREYWMEVGGGSHLLVVLFDGANGDQDGMGFEVGDRDGWVAALGGER